MLPLRSRRPQEVSHTGRIAAARHLDASTTAPPLWISPGIPWLPAQRQARRSLSLKCVLEGVASIRLQRYAIIGNAIQVLTKIFFDLRMEFGVFFLSMRLAEKRMKHA